MFNSDGLAPIIATPLWACQDSINLEKPGIYPISRVSGPPLTLDGTHRQARCHVAAQRIEDRNRR